MRLLRPPPRRPKRPPRHPATPGRPRRSQRPLRRPRQSRASHPHQLRRPRQTSSLDPRKRPSHARSAHQIPPSGTSPHLTLNPNHTRQGRARRQSRATPPLPRGRRRLPSKTSPAISGHGGRSRSRSRQLPGPGSRKRPIHLFPRGSPPPGKPRAMRRRNGRRRSLNERQQPPPRRHVRTLPGRCRSASHRASSSPPRLRRHKEQGRRPALTPRLPRSDNRRPRQSRTTRHRRSLSHPLGTDSPLPRRRPRHPARRLKAREP